MNETLKTQGALTPDTKITDTRMDQLIARARSAATIGRGGGDGSSYSETFNPDVYKTTLDQLIANETRRECDAATTE